MVFSEEIMAMLSPGVRKVLLETVAAEPQRRIDETARAALIATYHHHTSRTCEECAVIAYDLAEALEAERAKRIEARGA